MKESSKKILHNQLRMMSMGMAAQTECDVRATYNFIDFEGNEAEFICQFTAPIKLHVQCLSRLDNRDDLMELHEGFGSLPVVGAILLVGKTGGSVFHTTPLKLVQTAGDGVWLCETESGAKYRVAVA